MSPQYGHKLNIQIPSLTIFQNLEYEMILCLSMDALTWRQRVFVLINILWKDNLPPEENILLSFRESVVEEEKSNSSFGDFPATLAPPLSDSRPASDVEKKSSGKLSRRNTDESSTESMG